MCFISSLCQYWEVGHFNRCNQVFWPSWVFLICFEGLLNFSLTVLLSQLRHMSTSVLRFGKITVAKYFKANCLHSSETRTSLSQASSVVSVKYKKLEFKISHSPVSSDILIFLIFHDERAFIHMHNKIKCVLIKCQRYTLNLVSVIKILKQLL